MFWCVGGRLLGVSIFINLSLFLFCPTLFLHLDFLNLRLFRNWVLNFCDCLLLNFRLTSVRCWLCCNCLNRCIIVLCNCLGCLYGCLLWFTSTTLWLYPCRSFCFCFFYFNYRLNCIFLLGSLLLCGCSLTHCWFSTRQFVGLLTVACLGNYHFFGCLFCHFV